MENVLDSISVINKCNTYKKSSLISWFNEYRKMFQNIDKEKKKVNR